MSAKGEEGLNGDLLFGLLLWCQIRPDGLSLSDGTKTLYSSSGHDKHPKSTVRQKNAAVLTVIICGC